MLAIEKSHLAVCKLFLETTKDSWENRKDYDNALHLAVEKGKDEVVKLFFSLNENKPSIERRDSDGNTLLLVAAKGGHQIICEMLVKVNADLLAKNNDEATVLHLAADGGKDKAVEFFLSTIKKQQLIVLKNKDGNTSLLIAAQKGHRAICEQLIKSGANPLVTGNNNCSVLHWAAIHGDYALCELLLKHKLNPTEHDIFGCSPLFRAVENGHFTVCKLFLEDCKQYLKAEEVDNSIHKRLSLIFERERKQIYRKARELGQKDMLELITQYGTS